MKANHLSNNRIKYIICLIACLSLLLCGCEASPVVPLSDSIDSTAPASPQGNSPNSSSSDSDDPIAYRDSTPVCLKCEAPGTSVDGNEFVAIDYSNNKDGYIMINYLGEAAKVKLQITGPNQVTYTYDLAKGFAAIPLTSGDGEYSISVCENIVDNKYSVVFATALTFTGIDEFGPYLYPNQYVSFDSSKKTVSKGAELASTCKDELEVVTNIYNYIISNIKYDYDKADNVGTGYISDVDEILDSKTGICLDYAAVMTSMLRTQSIPTRLEVGYVGKDMVYHAWISVYIEEIGWLNGVIQFNGKEWSLVDPTFGSTTSEKQLKSYIGDGTNYSVKYIY
ncbi:MAG: transglutaminase-like domain-containing protein [Lachnospiraceae bacterium]|nr:transglutaminase-like domain-containing protein [Lachnospiraceae bacterium]